MRFAHHPVDRLQAASTPAMVVTVGPPLGARSWSSTTRIAPADDLYHAVRDAITRASDLSAVAEREIVRAHAGLSKLALALEASRTMRVQTIDLVIAACELRRAAGG